MRRKEFAKGIGLGLAVAALVGGLFQVVQVISAAEGDPPMLRTGVGHFGDVVTYQTTWSEEYRDGEEECRAHGVGQSTYGVVGPAMRTNQSGTAFTTAVVTERDANQDHAPACASAPKNHNHRFVDISTREVVRFNQHWSHAWQHNPSFGLPVRSPLAFPREGNGTGIFLAPDFGGAWAKEYATRPSLWSAALFQDMTFEAGQDVGHVLGTVRNSSPLNKNHSAQVELVGAADGRAVFVIRSKEAYNDSWRKDGTLWRFERRLEQQLWFRDGDAWPFRSNFTASYLYDAHGTTHEDSSWAFETHAALITATLGTRPIPWGAATGSARPVAVEWSPRSYPISGGLNRIPYKVEDAIDNVEQDPMLVTFTAWRLQNPDHRLVGFRYMGAGYADIDADDQHTWVLIYSAPFGEKVYRVSSKWKDGSIYNDGGEQDVPEGRDRFNPAWIQARYPTLQSVDQQWKNTMEPSIYDMGPNYIWWGMQPHRPTDSFQKMDQFFKHVGYTRFIKTASTPVFHVSGFASVTWNMVIVRADSNDIYEAFANRFTRDPEKFAPVIAAAEIPSAEAAAPNAGPNIYPWVASVTAFSIFLAAYLYPALQQAFLSLFSKLARHRVLHHRLRSSLHDAIQEDPGISRAEIQARVEAPMSTVIHHLKVMEQHHVVTSVRDGRNLRFFPATGVTAGARQELTVLQNERTRQTLDLVRAQPGVDRQTLAQLLSLTVPAVAWHLDRLQKAALLRVERRGRTLTYFLARETPNMNLQTTKVPQGPLPAKA